MNIVFIGNVDFSFNILDVLIKNKINISGVVTSQNKKINSDFYDLKPICKKNNIPMLFVDSVNTTKCIKWIKKLNCDLILCMGWSGILKNDIISIPSKGVVGYHPADLPKNRGRHPIIWTIALGLKQTRSTFFMIDQGIDSGPIISQKKILIKETDDAKKLYLKLIKSARLQIIQIIKNLNNGSLKFKIQNHKIANYWRKRELKDGCIDWRMKNVAINQLIKSLVKPYPGAHFMHKEKMIKVNKAKVIKNILSNYNYEFGKIVRVFNSEIDVVCGEGIIRLLDYKPKIKVKINQYL